MKKTFIIFTLLSIQSCCLGLNILVITWAFPNPFHTFVLDDIVGLLEHGHTVNIYALTNRSKALDANTALKLLSDKYSKYNLLNLTYYHREKEKTNAFLKNNNIDLLYCYFGNTELVTQTINIKKQYCNNAKIVVGFHGADIPQIINDPIICKKYSKSIDLFLPISKYFYQLLANKFDKTKIKILYLGVDKELFTPKTNWKLHEKSQLLSIGRLMEEKGFQYSIKAFSSIAKKYPYAQYTIIGEGPQRKDLEKLIHDLNLEEKIHLVGPKKRSEIPQWLAKADIFVMPSITGSNGEIEGIPTVLKEAMLTKVPCIGTRHSGIPEIIEDNATGLLVNEKNINELAQAISKLLENEELRMKLGKSGHRLIEDKFSRRKQDDFLDKSFKELAMPKNN